MTKRSAILDLPWTCIVLAMGVLVSGCSTSVDHTVIASDQAMSFSLRRLDSTEITQLISGRSLTPAEVVGVGVEIFHEDGRYEARSRALLSGRYEINDGLLCTWLDGPRHHRCRQILIDPTGSTFSIEVGDVPESNKAPIKIAIQ